MKKIMIISSILLMFLFTSCDDRPSCEENNTCTINVVNNTGYPLYVDVTWGNLDYNDERLIENNTYTTYHNIPSGDVVIWGSFDDNNWTYSDFFIKHFLI